MSRAVVECMEPILLPVVFLAVTLAVILDVAECLQCFQLTGIHAPDRTGRPGDSTNARGACGDVPPSVRWAA